MVMNRYRITSLICRRPSLRLFFAIDTQRQEPVVIRDIDSKNLDEGARQKALAALQEEHSLLGRLRITDLMQCSTFHHAQGHLYSIARQPESWPAVNRRDGEKSPPRLYTLQDLLQSGIGLPAEAVAVAWIARLADAVERLHQQRIVFGELDPDTIISSAEDYNGTPALMIAWLPEALRRYLPQASNATNTNKFSAPEALQGKPDKRSDIYSLGAILYLLLSGRSPTPAEATEQAQSITRLRELNPRVNSAIEAVVMQALTSDPTQRIQNAGELADALRDPHRAYHTYAAAHQTKHAEHPDLRPEEMTFSSDKDNNETGKRTEAQSLSAALDERTQIVPPQAQHARRYLSRINTQKLEQEKQSGEVMGKKVHMQEEPVENTVEKKGKQDKVAGKVGGDENNAKAKGQGSAEQPAAVDQADETTQPTAREKDQARVRQSAASPTTNEQVAVPSSPAEEKAETPMPEAQKTPEQVEDTTRKHTDRREEIADLPTYQLSKKDVVERATQEAQEEQPAPTDKRSKKPQQEPAQEKAQPEIYDIPTVNISRTELAGTLQAAQASQQPEQQAAARSTPTRAPGEQAKEQAAAAKPGEQTGEERKESPIERFKGIVTGKLPALPRRAQSGTQGTPASTPKGEDKAPTLLRHVKRFLLGEQQHRTAAAALIETPMRVQPTQSYAIRIHIMGRDTTRDGEDAAGLSALVRGDIVHIEVRSALYQNYAYIVQQADVEIPAGGFAAEVTMPMRPLAKGPTSRRERLHIFFMDAERHPLYEKPFVIELFISPLVQAGREGHNVLSIPV